MARLTIYLRPIAERRQGGYAAGDDAGRTAEYGWHGTIKDIGREPSAAWFDTNNFYLQHRREYRGNSGQVAGP